MHDLYYWLCDLEEDVANADAIPALKQREDIVEHAIIAPEGPMRSDVESALSIVGKEGPIVDSRATRNLEERWMQGEFEMLDVVDVDSPGKVTPSITNLDMVDTWTQKNSTMPTPPPDPRNVGISMEAIWSHHHQSLFLIASDCWIRLSSLVHCPVWWSLCPS